MKRLLLFLGVAAALIVGSIALFYAVKPIDLLPPVSISNESAPTALPTVQKQNFEHNLKLQSDADALLPLFDQMPAVPVYLKDEIVSKGGSNIERGVGYTTCENKNQPTIYLKKVFYQKTNRKQLVNILKHELTHAYFCRQGVQEGHDARWRKKFAEVGGFGN